VAAPKRRTIRQHVFVRASPKKVFKAISQPKLLRRWLLDEAELSPRKGGRYRFVWKGGPTHTGKVLEFVRGKRLTLTWEWPELEAAGVTRLKLSVLPKHGGTVLKFVHSGLPIGERWVELYGGAIQGWTYFGMNLKSVLEHDHDLRSDDDW
jgi:uncharacterized protein YndB with AHSA1/START domain